MIPDLRDWIPYRIDVAPDVPVVQWCHTGGRRLTEPFFEQDLGGLMAHPFNRGFDVRTTIDEASSYLDDHPPLAPRGFIFHLGRCGSTLAARMLAADPANRVLSEPSPFDVVVRAPLRRPVDPDTYHSWLRTALGGLSQPCNGERRLFVKFDCWTVMAADHLAAAFPDVPWLVLYRDPLEVLVSMLAAKPLTLMPAMVPPALFGVSMEEALMMPEEDYAARVLGALLDQFTNLAEKAHVIHYPDMPTALWGWLDDLEIDPPNEARTAMQEVSAQNAKRPGQVFHPDGAAKKAATTAAQTEAVARYAMEPYLRLRAAGHPVV